MFSHSDVSADYMALLWATCCPSATGCAGLSHMHILGHPIAVAIMSTRQVAIHTKICVFRYHRMHSINAPIITCVKKTRLLVLQEDCIILN
jgi:hypothetical protein